MVALTGGLLAAPVLAQAQQGAGRYRIGYLSAASPASATVKSSLENFQHGLHDLGYVEGREFVMEYRFADGQTDRLPQLASELVRAHVDLIVSAGTPATLAAKQATGTIPIVSPVAGNLVENGIVKSLAHPGGNVTGLTTQVNLLKLCQLLTEAAPKVGHIALLYDPATSPRGAAERLTSRGHTAKIDLQVVALHDPDDIARAFREFRSGTNGLLLDRPTPLVLRADEICKIALRRKLPTAAGTRAFVDAGCLMSYGESMNDMFRRAAVYVDKILKGAKPADLPVEQPTKFELVINLRTAKALGLAIPPSLLGRADQVIE